MKSTISLTILIPCLNEEKTLAVCVKKAKSYIKKSGLSAEVLVADNGSTDNSRLIAVENGARVISVHKKGYGNALLAGIKHSKGKFIIMGDADDSYSFLQLDGFINKLDEGYDLVMGNRFSGHIQKGSMPFLNRYIGNPFLSFVAKKLYKCPAGDFHCGLRGFDKKSILSLGLACGGMEFASEMLIKARLKELKITEIPINFYCDGRNSKSHLRPFRDGLRHLEVINRYKKYSQRIKRIKAYDPKNNS